MWYNFMEKALEDRLMRIHRHAECESRYQRIRAIVDSRPPVACGVTRDHSDLYDDDGLPA